MNISNIFFFTPNGCILAFPAAKLNTIYPITNLLFVNILYLSFPANVVRFSSLDLNEN